MDLLVIARAKNWQAKSPGSMAGSSHATSWVHETGGTTAPGPDKRDPYHSPYFKGLLGNGMGDVWEWGSHFGGSLEFPLKRWNTGTWS